MLRRLRCREGGWKRNQLTGAASFKITPKHRKRIGGGEQSFYQIKRGQAIIETNMCGGKGRGEGTGSTEEKTKS